MRIYSERATRIVRLPMGLADFGKRGFRTDRRDARHALETHARSFLNGFNLAVGHWRAPHAELARIPDEERGFAYEGAAMHAAVCDSVTLGRAGALRALLDGEGDGYVHLIHVGYGWGRALLRLPPSVPATPLLRWLALDGAGFAETFFGGKAASRRRCGKRPSEHWAARVAGSGRALWFAESADVGGVVRTIETMPAPARPQLWAGIGLAACYAGCSDEPGLTRLAEASGADRSHFEQGALFAIAARFRARIVPEQTELACKHLFAVDPGTAAAWTDEAAAGLTENPELAAYTEWKARLRGIAVTRRRS
ncbi:DUF1702 family protein [Amycolatopsis speibonae]|uniref:DUF1702 family protein n=1 Tax=Amycolatopsis speibonae TaxID=1450224 RepID=A0ABV7NSV7_9PSEU